MTFAPRKTCHIGSNLTFHSYHATAIDIIHGLSKKSKNFFDFLSKKRKMKRSILFHSFYNRKNLNPQIHDTEKRTMMEVPEGVDAELLAKVLSNPEMAVLLTSLAKSMQGEHN